MEEMARGSLVESEAAIVVLQGVGVGELCDPLIYISCCRAFIAFISYRFFPPCWVSKQILTPLL